MTRQRSIMRSAERSGRRGLHRSFPGKNLRQKLAGAVLALGLAVLPWSEAQADAVSGNIKFDGADAALSASSNVFDIYAQQVNGTIATNRFESFNLADNQIANMYFKTSAGASTEASALFNFVKNDINIAGTVNAIRGNKIGGEMFFLTPKSIVVSGSGVINAGAITLMAGGKYPVNDGEALTFAGNIQSGTYLLDKNAEGSVSVAGRLNVTDYIRIVSSKSIVLKTEKDEAGNVTGTGQLITNTSFDFKDVVNIKNADGSLLVDAGLNKDSLILTRSSGSNGNIMLEARATNTNERDKAIEGWMNVAGDNTVKAEVTIGEGTTVSAAGGEVSIDATALRDHSKYGNLATFGDIGGAAAAVTVNGTVSGSTVSVTAQAENKYTKSSWENLTGTVKNAIKTELNNLVGDIGNLEIAFLGHRTTSTVEFDTGATVTATGADTVDSKGNVTKEALRVSATTQDKLRSNINASSAGSEDGHNYADVGFLYGYLENDAAVKVKSGAKLNTANAAGSMQLTSKAETDMMLRAGATSGQKPQEADKFSAAVLVALGHTGTQLEVAQGAELAAGKNLTLCADTKHSTCNEASVNATDNTYVSTALQITNMDSSAAVNVNGSLRANSGKLDIGAADTAAVNAYANNAVSTGVDEPSLLDVVSKYVPDKAKDLVNGAVGKVKESFKKDAAEAESDAVELEDLDNPEEPAVNPDTGIADTALSLGASINVTVGRHTAEINAGEKAVLTSGGEMKLDAVQKLDDVNLTALGASSASNSGAVINASILSAGLETGAAVNLKGNKTDGGARLTAGGAMTINAATSYEWNRVKAMADFFMDRWKTFAASYKDLFTDEMKGVDRAVEAYKANPTTENYKNIAKAMEAETFFSNLTSLVNIPYKSPGDLVNVIRAAEDFLNGSGYTNINVGSVAKNSGQGGHAQAEADVAVALALENFKSRAVVLVGDRAELTAGGRLETKAEAKQLEVNYYGALQGIGSFVDEQAGLNETLRKVMEKSELDLTILPAWNKGENAVGASVGWSRNDVESGVIVAEGAKLTAQSIDVTADTDVKRVLVTLGGGSAGKTGFTGMFSSSVGKTNSFVVVDDEASLCAQKAAETNDAVSKEGAKLTADNDALIVNALGNLTLGGSSLGAAAGYVENKVNTIAGVADNDKDATTAKGSEAEKVKNLLGALLTGEQKKFLGLAATQTDGLIEVPALQIGAEGTPIIWNVAVAGAVARSNQQGGNAGEVIELDDLAGGGGNQGDLAEIGAGSGQVSGTTLTGAGTVSIQKLRGTTSALLENAKVKLLNAADGTRNVDLKAYENGMAVGADGALALKRSGQAGGTTVSVAGTSADNDISMDVVSQIKGSTITDAAAVSNYAHQDETLVAVAVPLTFDASGQDSKGFSTALNISVNKVDNKVLANMQDNTVGLSGGLSGATDVQNVAYDTSAQITGGLNVDQSKSSVGLGVNAAWARLTNNVSATVTGGSYTGIGTFNNEAATQLKQVTLAVGAGVGTGESSLLAAGAVWTHAAVNNNVSAVLQNAIISGLSVTNRAYDGEVTGGSAQTNTWRALAAELGVDVNGTATEGLLAAQRLDTDVEDDELNTLAGGNITAAGNIAGGSASPAAAADKPMVYQNSSLSFADNKGNKIYTGAIELMVNTGERSLAALGVSVADSTVNNDYTAKVSGVTAALSGEAGLVVQAKSDSYLADFAAGLAVSASGGKSFLQGAGSAAVSSLDNDTIAVIEGSTVSAAKAEAKAETTGTIVGVAGSVGYTDSKAGIGLSVAKNKLDNLTKAGIYSSTLQGYNGGNTALAADAKNTGRLLALGVGVNANGGNEAYLAAQGNVALNYGKTDTVAEMDKTANGAANTVTGASALQITATDTTTQKAVAVGLEISSAKGTLGFSYAENDIEKQKLAARLSNTNITAAAGGADIDVRTDEITRLTTAAAGAGLTKGEWGTLEGYAAVTRTSGKENTAEVSHTVLTDAGQLSDVEVKAKAVNKIISTADAITVNINEDSKLSGAVAVTANDLNGNVTAKIDTATLSAKDAAAVATSDDKIYNVALGVSGSRSTVNAAGSVSTNKLGNNVAAEVKDSTVKALNSVGVLADSSDRLINVTGGLSIGVKSTVGVGFAAAVNEVYGDTVATVSGSAIEALGRGTKKLTSHQFTTDTENKMSVTKEDEDTAKAAAAEHKGLLVDACSRHDSTDVAVTAGAAGGAEGADVALAGTGSSNKLTGKTEALVTNTDINKAADGQGDITVTALEDTKITAVDVNVSVAAAGELNLSGGAAVSVGNLDRTVNAKLTADEGNAKTVNADRLTVEAGARSRAKLVTVGVDAGVGGSGGGAGGAVVDSLHSTYHINATISNINGSNNGLTFRAARDGITDYTAVGVNIGFGGDGAGALGAVVGVMKDESTVTGSVRNVTQDHRDKTAKDLLAVTNYSESTPDLVSVNLSGAAYGAGSIGVTVDNHKLNDSLRLELDRAHLGTAEHTAAQADLTVDSKYKLVKDTVNIDIAAALGSGAVGVTSQPITINSSNVLNVTGSSLYAAKLNLTNNELRSVHLNNTTVTGAAELGVGVTYSHLVMGGKLQNSYATSHNDAENNARSQEDLLSTLNVVNKTVQGAEKKLKDGAAGSTAGLTTTVGGKAVINRATVAEGGHTADQGTVNAEGQLLRASNSILVAEDVTLSSTVTDDIHVYSGTGGLGAVSVNVNMATVDETINNKIELAGGSIAADNISVLNRVTGTTYAHAAIGLFGALNINLGYADVYAKGGSSVAVNGTTMLAGKGMLVRSLHDSTYSTYTNGGDFAALTGSYTEAESKDSLKSSVTVQNAVLTVLGQKTQDTNTTGLTATKAVNGALELAAIKSSLAKSETKYGNVTGIGVGANSSTALVDGKSTLVFNNNKVYDSYTEGSLTQRGTNAALDLYALYEGKADTEVLN